MSNSIPLSELTSSPAAKFETIGASYVGRIVAIDKRQQTDTAGRPLSFNDGQPREQYVISIEQSNGDTVALYAKGGTFKASQGSGQSMLAAIADAARAAGAAALSVGDEVAVAHTGLAEAQPGKSPAKLYTAQYRTAPAPAASVPVADLFSGGQP